jgi:hypothetical protein
VIMMLCICSLPSVHLFGLLQFGRTVARAPRHVLVQDWCRIVELNWMWKLVSGVIDLVNWICWTDSLLCGVPAIQAVRHPV